MPQLDGVGLYRALTERNDRPLTKFIFLTGSVGSPELHRFLNETGLPLLRKPFNLAGLQRVVREALESR